MSGCRYSFIAGVPGVGACLLSLKGYRAGQFNCLRVLEAQRAYAQADLAAVRSLDEMRRAVVELSGLLLEDEWPLPCPPVNAPVTERRHP